MTHDSIGLGEDGPTHQPVEHLAALRAMPNLNVFRPADAVETAECWATGAGKPRTRPSILALTRQSAAVPAQRAADENRSAKGAYVLAEADGARQVTLLATGSEVAMAMEARAAAGASDGIARRGGLDAVLGIVRSEAPEYRDVGTGHARRGSPSRPRSGSAGSAMSAAPAHSSAMHGFGASAPTEALYPAFRHHRRGGRGAGRIGCLTGGKRSGGWNDDTIAINGFGRIGRLVLRALHETRPRRRRGRRRSTISARSRRTRIS